ncbi:hypothetical protein SAMN05216319_2694 [Duganella sp. CF402]|uniref:hypothetical protein n=1 Tax=unclassified Duganella TaxID=2636909 RepID=UPI0008CEDF9C|nr:MULTISPECIES: hypothetical protein [unclassified Duganella]RZT08888.1 hypothetical protein EV582_0927 [Duganella sp. BK701]SEL77954.1 hypothetical protein SAMN05216319_2694 [Duganella sp. CF402]
MKPTSRRKFLKSVTAASVVSTFGNAALIPTALAAECKAWQPASPDVSGTLGIVGDEVTAQFYSESATKIAYMANGYITWALALSGQRLRISKESRQAVAGATVLGTGDNDIRKQVERCVASSFTDIICMGGRIDLANGATPENVAAGWASILANVNARVWLVMQTPDNTQATAIKIYKLNQLLLNLGLSNVTVIDLASALSKVTTTKVSGTSTYLAWNSKMSTGGYKPINVSAYYIGKAIATAWQSLPQSFALLSDASDDIANDPRSFNILHNGLLYDEGVNRLLNLTGGSNYVPTNKIDNSFLVPFTGGGGGSGALAKATVSGGAIVSLEVINGGSNYTQAPVPDFSNGRPAGTSGTDATVTVLTGPSGFTHSTSTSAKTEQRCDNIGKDVLLELSFPNYQIKQGLFYTHTMGTPLINHIGPNDTYSVRCIVTLPQLADNKITAAGPNIQQYFQATDTTVVYDSCGVTNTDQPLPEAFEAAFLTPPVKPDASTSTKIYLQGSNDETWAEKTKGWVKFGRISCVVQPTKVCTPALKTNVKFNPGHYITVYPNWLYSDFMGQEGFDTSLTETKPKTAAWSGVEKQVKWRDIETEFDKYDFTSIDQWLTGLRGWNAAHPDRNPKRLIIYLLTDSYINPNDQFLPDYMYTNEYGVYEHNSGNGRKLCYHKESVQNRLIKLGQKLAEKYDQSEPLLEAFRLDETSPGDKLAKTFPAELTNYIEGQVRIADEINKAFKSTMMILGFNFVSDLKMSRAARMLVQAGVGMGAVDLIPKDASLSAPFASYDYIKLASKYVPSVVHFDGGNYTSNFLNVGQEVTGLADYSRDHLGASHICWYRNDWLPDPYNYWSAVRYLNSMQTDWDSIPNRYGNLSTVRPLSIE